MTIKSINILVPLKNEEKGIKNLIENLKSILGKIEKKTIISLIDDHSSDQTWKTLEQFKQQFDFIKIYKNENPTGFGNALRYGISKNQEDVVIIFMGDCSDNPEDIIEYVKYFEQGYDCVFGSRFISGAKVNDYPFVKLILKDQSNLYKITAKNFISNTKKKFSNLLIEEALSDIIVISKNLSLNDLQQLYGSCDAYVSPYRAEGFNITSLEAAACGLPVILTSGGSTDDYYDSSFALKIQGTKKVIKGNWNYIEPNLESLISNMSDLVEKRNFSLKKNHAFSFIENNFTWKLTAKKLADLFIND